MIYRKFKTFRSGDNSPFTGHLTHINLLCTVAMVTYFRREYNTICKSCKDIVKKNLFAEFSLKYCGKRDILRLVKIGFLITRNLK